MNDTCPVCGSRKSEEHVDLLQCKSCGHIWQASSMVSVSYGKEYLECYRNRPTAEMSCLRLGFLKAFIDGGKLLDIGYGRGDFAKLASLAGFRVYGCDVHGVDFGIREIDLTHDAETWDVVTAFDSIEHFADLTPLKSLFSRTKVVMVSVPFTPSWFPERRDWKHYKPGEHLHYFSPNSLQILVGKPTLRCAALEDLYRVPEGGQPQNIYTAIYGG